MVMLSVIFLSVIMPNVMAPLVLLCTFCFFNKKLSLFQLIFEGKKPQVRLFYWWAGAIKLVISLPYSHLINSPLRITSSHKLLMEQHALKNVYNHWNINISFYLETSGGQNFNLYLNGVHFFQQHAFKM